MPLSWSPSHPLPIISSPQAEQERIVEDDDTIGRLAEDVHFYVLEEDVCEGRSMYVDLVMPEPCPLSDPSL